MNCVHLPKYCPIELFRNLRNYIGEKEEMWRQITFSHPGNWQKSRRKKTSIVGTVNEAWRELPPSAKMMQQLHSSKLVKTAWLCNADCLPMKPKNNVCILSSVHLSASITTDEKRKPETVVCYNQTWCRRWRPDGSVVLGESWYIGEQLLLFTASWICPLPMLSFCAKREWTRKFHDETSSSNWLLNFDRSAWTVRCFVLHKRTIFQRFQASDRILHFNGRCVKLQPILRKTKQPNVAIVAEKWYAASAKPLQSHIHKLFYSARGLVGRNFTWSLIIQCLCIALPSVHKLFIPYIRSSLESSSQTVLAW